MASVSSCSLLHCYSIGSAKTFDFGVLVLAPLPVQ
jgi:hypothetical protein